MQKTIFITGATSGIGKAIAHHFASQYHHLILTGRRAERMEEFARYLKSVYGVMIHLIPFDIRSRQACEEAVAQLPEWVEQVDVLVNNAGGAIGRDPFDVADLDDWDTMLDTNVKGLLYITKALLPRIKQSKEPHIINIGSIAGKEVYENGNLYCAAKHAVHAISQSMRIDLLKYGIKVTLVAPGAVETEFSLVRFKGDAQKAAAVYQGYQPLTAEDVANVVGFAANQPPHVCLNEIVLTPTAQANSFYLHR